VLIKVCVKPRRSSINQSLQCRWLFLYGREEGQAWLSFRLCTEIVMTVHSWFLVCCRRHLGALRLALSEQWHCNRLASAALGSTRLVTAWLRSPQTEYLALCAPSRTCQAWPTTGPGPHKSRARPDRTALDRAVGRFRVAQTVPSRRSRCRRRRRWAGRPAGACFAGFAGGPRFGRPMTFPKRFTSPANHFSKRCTGIWSPLDLWFWGMRRWRPSSLRENSDELLHRRKMVYYIFHSTNKTPLTQ